VVRVKICGITCVEDALAAVSFGADALGFVFAPSPRRVSPDRARAIARELPPMVITVGVFVNAPLEWVREVQCLCGLSVVQLQGDEDEQATMLFGPRVIKALAVRPDRTIGEDSYPGATILLDAYSADARGGTGRTFDWSLATELAKKRPIILAGGLTPDNVLDAVRVVRPYAVDVSSGVEMDPGRKDHEKLERFIRRAKTLE
jgi:phosphoribosylanthranilate isomerase